MSETTLPAVTDLTRHQRRVLRVLRDLTAAAGGRGPTRRELADALGQSSVNAAQHTLDALARKGYLAWATGPGGVGVLARGIRLVGLELVPRFTDDEAGCRLRVALAEEEEVADG